MKPTSTSSDTSGFVPFQSVTLFGGLFPVHNITKFLQKDKILPNDTILLLAFQLQTLCIENYVRSCLRWINVNRSRSLLYFYTMSFVSFMSPHGRSRRIPISFVRHLACSTHQTRSECLHDIYDTIIKFL